MDFLKKIFGNKEEQEETQTPTEPSGGEVSQTQEAEQTPTKEDHDSGHPSGSGGKNVCEFC